MPDTLQVQPIADLTATHTIECKVGDKLTIVTATHVVICTIERVREREGDHTIGIHTDTSVQTGEPTA